jgi:phosphopantothenoylcysteine decarboxylase / phosphopantothenate---cysteine ligase
MACNEWGVGRMAEPLEILDAAAAILRGSAGSVLSGAHVLVTAGPTHEPIDPIRYIANRSSGRQGYAVAAASAALGARVTLVSGPVAIDPPEGVTVIRVETAREMLAASLDALPADIGIFTAAVADWRTTANHVEKIKKGGKGKPPALTLVENPDILATIAKHASLRPPLVIGFAAETENLMAYATKKLATKGCDWIVANDVSLEGGVMGGRENQVQLVTAQGVESWPQMSKEAVAEELMRRAAAALHEARRGFSAAAE